MPGNGYLICTGRVQQRREHLADLIRSEMLHNHRFIQQATQFAALYKQGFNFDQDTLILPCFVGGIDISLPAG